MAPPWDAGRPVSARGRYYVSCAASATTTLTEGTPGQVGNVGDEIDWLWLFPNTTTPGAATLQDGGITVWTWPAGITLADIRPILVPLNLRSRVGAWSVGLGATMTALAAGAFT